MASSARPCRCPSTTTTWAATRSDLLVDRLPSDDRDARIGSLLVNPGGPGGSGADYARGLAQQVGDGVRAAYDIVGFDPRGVGSSEPVECVGTEELDELIASEGSPDDDAEVQEALDILRDIRRCVRAGAARPVGAHVDRRGRA